MTQAITDMIELRDHRLVRGMTLKQMADLARVSIVTLCKVERGETKRPNARHIERIAMAYGLSTRDFIRAIDYTRAQRRSARRIHEEREATDGHVTSNPGQPVHAARR